MNHRRATIFLCAVLALQAIPSRSAAGTWRWEYKELSRELSRSKNMILAGWLMAGGGTLVGIGAGIPLLLRVYSEYGPCSPSRPYNENCGMQVPIYCGIITIPLVGPAFAGGVLLGEVEGGGIAFAIFLIVDSVIQIAGFTLAIVGHVKHSKAMKKIKDEGLSAAGSPNDRFGIAAAPFAAAGGGGIAVRGTF